MALGKEYYLRVDLASGDGLLYTISLDLY